MKWSKKVPSHSGWYWALPMTPPSPRSGPEIVELDLEGSITGKPSVYRSGAGVEAYFDPNDFALWGDLIPQPVLPTKIREQWCQVQLEHYELLHKHYASSSVPEIPAAIGREIRILRAALFLDDLPGKEKDLS